MASPTPLQHADAIEVAVEHNDDPTNQSAANHDDQITIMQQDLQALSMTPSVQAPPKSKKRPATREEKFEKAIMLREQALRDMKRKAETEKRMKDARRVLKEAEKMKEKLEIREASRSEKIQDLTQEFSFFEYMEYEKQRNRKPGNGHGGVSDDGSNAGSEDEQGEE